MRNNMLAVLISCAAITAFEANAAILVDGSWNSVQTTLQALTPNQTSLSLQSFPINATPQEQNDQAQSILLATMNTNGGGSNVAYRISNGTAFSYTAAGHYILTSSNSNPLPLNISAGSSPWTYDTNSQFVLCTTAGACNATFEVPSGVAIAADTWTVIVTAATYSA